MIIHIRNMTNVVYMTYIFYGVYTYINSMIYIE